MTEHTHLVAKGLGSSFCTQPLQPGGGQAASLHFGLPVLMVQPAERSLYPGSAPAVRCIVYSSNFHTFVNCWLTIYLNKYKKLLVKPQNNHFQN